MEMEYFLTKKALAGVSYGMYQVLHDTNSVTDSGCHCVSADHSSRVVGSDSVVARAKSTSCDLSSFGPALFEI